MFNTGQLNGCIHLGAQNPGQGRAGGSQRGGGGGTAREQPCSHSCPALTPALPLLGGGKLNQTLPGAQGGSTRIPGLLKS